MSDKDKGKDKRTKNSDAEKKRAQRKNQSKRDIKKNILGASHFTSSVSNISTESTDPVQPIGITINLDQIETYDRNPRRAENDSYEELKKDLRADGSERVTITITRRPGADKYMPDMGGNTRLTILKELYQETGDEKYYWLRVTFIPYKDESDVLIHHLIENDVRSDYIFIDRALGVRAAYNQLCEDDQTSYSQRKFIEQLNKRGYSNIIRSSLIDYNYAIDHLYEHMPNALDGGMGRPNVRSLKRIERIYSDYWVAHNLDESELKVYWNEILSRNDSWDSFSVDLVERDLLVLIASRIQDALPDYPALITVDTVKLDVDQYQRDPDLVSTLSSEPNYGWPTERDTADGDTTKVVGPISGAAGSNESTEPHKTDEQSSLFDGVAKPNEDHTDHTLDDEPPYTDIANRTPAKAHLFNLQERCFKTASKLAKHFGFSDVLFRLDCGYGYYCEIPDAAFHQTDELKAWFWWQLFLVASVHHYDNFERLPGTSNYRALVTDLFDANPPLENDDIVRDVLGQIEANIGKTVPRTSPFINTPLIFEGDHVEEPVFDQYIKLLRLRRKMRDQFKLEELWS